MPEILVKDSGVMLIGSGFSRALKFPSVDELTQRTRSMEGNASDALRAILNTLEPIYSTVLPREWKLKQRPNYEEIYYYSTTISRAYADPIHDANASIARKEFHAQLESTLGHKCGGDCADGVLHVMMESILDIVHGDLNRRITSVSPLEHFCAMLRDLSPAGVRVFTTNHDLVLERIFREIDQDYVDGFNFTKGREYVWDVRQFQDSKLPWLVKLHGSIDWRKASGPNYFKAIRKIDAEVPGYGPPELLLGTLNKYFEYTQGIYFSGLQLLANSLRESSKLLSIGYGFGDLGVNNLIVHWLEGSKDRRVVIVDPNAKELEREFLEAYDFLRTALDCREEDSNGNLVVPDSRMLAAGTRIERVHWDGASISWD